MPAATPRKATKADATAKKAPKPRAPPPAGKPRGKTAKAAKPRGPPAPRKAGTKPRAATPPTAGWIAEGTQPAPTPAQGGTPVAPPLAVARPSAFDPVTGAWLPAPPVSAPAPAAIAAPEAARASSPFSVFVSILLWIDLVFLGINTLMAIAFGIVLIFAPDSGSADWIRDSLTGGTRTELVTSTLLSFVGFGVIPLLYVLGTRRVPVEGTKRFLHLHLRKPAKDILRGVGLALGMLVAVAVVMGGYTIATEGVDALTDPEQGSNPAVEGLLDNLTWPLAVLVALCAGIGEEIFFRGFLQRYIGVWGQSVLFGLGHLSGGYLPQVVFALGMGVMLGFLVKRGWSLWTMITAHALYNFTLLAMALIAPETA